MTDLEGAAAEFRQLAKALTEVGLDDVKRELYQAINDAARPLGREVANAGHLKPYMPNRYAEILAEDLAIQISKRTGTDPGVALRAKGRRHARQVSRLNRGIITHPVFARSAQERSQWAWVTQSIRPRFFDDPTQRAGPQVRQQIEDAMRRITDRIYRR